MTAGLVAGLSATVFLLALSTTPASAHPTFAMLTGAGPGGAPLVRAFTRAGASTSPEYQAYVPGFRGGVYVASADVNGDEHADSITGAGSGGAPLVHVVDGITGSTIYSFMAYDPGFRGGVTVAAGDINFDGIPDIITGPGQGGAPNVRVFDGDTLAKIVSFNAYSSSFSGGVDVAAGDLNSDGIADIITGAGPGGAPNVRVFDGDSLAAIVSFNAYGSTFHGGVHVGSGDVTGDGLTDIITGAGPGGAPNVRVFDGDSLAKIYSFNAYVSSFTGGVFVSAGDINIDEFADIITGAGPGGGPHVKAFDGDTLSTLLSFNAYVSGFRGGVRVAGNLGTHPPVVEVTGGPADEGTTSDSTPTYSGTATDSDGIVLDFAVSVDFGDFSADGVICTDCGTDDATWTFTPTAPLPDGEHVFIFAAVDNSGLIGFDSRTVGIDVIPGPPTVTVNQADTQADPTNEASIEYTVVFSEPVTGLTVDDFVVTGTAPGAEATSLTGGPSTYTVAITGMTGDGTVIVNLPAAAAEDGAGNPSGASTSSDNTVTWDATAPTFDSIASSTSPTVSAFFSEPLACATVTASDFLASIAGSPVVVNSVSCTGGDPVVELTLASSPTAGQSVSVSLVSTVTDPAGNAAPQPTTKTTTADATGPTATVNQASGQADPTNDATIDFTVVFNEPVTGLTAGDFDVTGTAADAEVTSLTGGPTTYAIGITGMTSDGTVIASLPVAVVTDLAGNDNAASTSTDNTVTFDATEPTVTINQAAGQTDPTITSPINFTAVFSEPMDDFVGMGVSVTGTAGGTKSAVVTGGPTTYNIAISGMTTPGTVVATIPADTWTDPAGNGNLVSTSTDNSVTWDVAPTVTVEQAVAQADPTNDDPINFTATFSESVTGLVDADVTIGGTAGGTLSATVTGSGTTYNIAVTGMTTDGTVTASILANKAVDAGGFGNLASTSSDNSVTWDTTAPGFSWVSSTAGSSTVTAVFGSVDDAILCSTVAAGDFLATVNGLPVVVSGVTCDGTADATIQVALASAPAAGQATSLALAGTVTDRAGNAVTTDTLESIASSPTLSVTSGTADGGSTTDTTPTYSGTAADGADTVMAVEVSIDGGLTFSSSGVTCVLCGTLPGIGVNWSYTPASPLALGAHTLVFRAVDDDGGFSLPSVRHVTITS